MSSKKWLDTLTILFSATFHAIVVSQLLKIGMQRPRSAVYSSKEGWCGGVEYWAVIEQPSDAHCPGLGYECAEQN